MKTSFSATMAILGLAIASAFAQTQSTTSSNTTYIETSKFIGKPVKSAQGDQIGTVKDIVLDRNTGCLAYTVLSTTGGGGGGTRVSGGGKMVAVPWSVYSPSTDMNVVTVTVDRDRIYNAPVFDYARVEEYSRPDYINNVYSYYGVSPGGGVGVGVSGGTSTTTTGARTTGATTTTGSATGANTTSGAAASPAAGASVSGSAAPNATEGRRAHPGATAATGAATGRARETATPSSYGRPSNSPSRERTPITKQKHETSPSSRDAERSDTGTRSEMPPTTERAPSEGASTGEKTKGSTRERSRGREETSPPERPQE
jgi:sporulation protein YlmC with PRC-barrel domain